MSAPIRVFLLDDHDVVRTGMAAAITTEPDIEVVGDAGDAATAIQMIGELLPDVAVLDVRLQNGGTGIEVCREVSEKYPSVRSLILTSFDDDHAVVQAAAAGAVGFMLKQIRSEELVEAIRQVADGRRLLDGAQVRLATQRLESSDEGRLADLSPQERRIFDLIGQGKTNREIASDLYLAEKTVKNYVSHMLAKLGMSRRTEAAALAARVDAHRTK